MLAEHTSREFIDFIENEWQPVPGTFYETKIQFQRFLEIFPDFAKLQQAKFTRWIKMYMKKRIKKRND